MPPGPPLGAPLYSSFPQKARAQQACISLLLGLSPDHPLRASEVGDPCPNPSRLPEVGPLIKYDTILQGLSQEVLKVRQQSRKVVPTSPLRLASSLVAHCCRLIDRNCTFSGRNKESLGETVWDPFWLLLGVIPAPPPCGGDSRDNATFSREKTPISLLGLLQGVRLPRQFLPLGQGTRVDHEGTNSSLRGGGAFRTGRPPSWRANSPSRAALPPSGPRPSPAVWPGQGASSGHL